MSFKNLANLAYHLVNQESLKKIDSTWTAILFPFKNPSDF